MSRKIDYIDEEDRKWIEKHLVRCKSREIIEKDVLKAAWYVNNPPFPFMTVMCTHDGDWWVGEGPQGDTRFIDTSGIWNEYHVADGYTVRERFMYVVKTKVDEAQLRYQRLHEAYTRKWEWDRKESGNGQRQQ